MDEALRYEHFVRGAFEKFSGKNVGRGEDPAALAEAGLVNVNDITSVKVGTSYAMYTYNNIIINSNTSLSDAERTHMDTIIQDVLNANSVVQIDQYISQYKKAYFKYL